MEGALVSIDAGTGEIMALAGGFDPRLGQYDHAVQALRQPGSTFKPFVFSAALETGYFPGSLVEDLRREVTPPARGRQAWAPRNYGNQYEGVISVRRALARSKNVAAVNLMEAAGAPYVQEFATRFGFDPQVNPAAMRATFGSRGTRRASRRWSGWDTTSPAASAEPRAAPMRCPSGRST